MHLKEKVRRNLTHALWPSPPQGELDHRLQRARAGERLNHPCIPIFPICPNIFFTLSSLRHPQYLKCKCKYSLILTRIRFLNITSHRDLSDMKVTWEEKELRDVLSRTLPHKTLRCIDRQTSQLCQSRVMWRNQYDQYIGKLNINNVRCKETFEPKNAESWIRS